MIEPWAMWLKPGLWPEYEPEGHVFIAQAFNAVGELLFPERWSGGEVASACLPALKRIPPAHQVFNKDGTPRWGLHQHYGPMVANLVAIPPGHGLDTVTRDLWERVQPLYMEEVNKRMQATFQRDVTAEHFAELARNGHLVCSAWHRVRGGELRRIAPGEWQIPYPWLPIATMGYDEENGLGSPIPTHWLFVSSDSLRALIAGENVPKTDVETPTAFSAPTRNELTQLLAEQLDSEGVAKRDVKASHIAERWRHEGIPFPKVSAVTNLMTGLAKGRRRTIN